MRVEARLDTLPISPRKVRLVADAIKGLDVSMAVFYLEQEARRAMLPLLKLLKSAMANAEHNYGLDKTKLYVYDIQVGDGVRMKRYMPRAYGRASQILKRTSHVRLVLSGDTEIERNSDTASKKEKSSSSVSRSARRTRSDHSASSVGSVSGKLGRSSGGKKPAVFRRKAT
ncbi:MAG: 50S ribosomal protein L22 [Candidatus Moranbacteria bacterium]|nr:50S ribosomal protein L22 [Candidatus Moranbacteria bacterium]